MCGAGAPALLSATEWLRGDTGDLAVQEHPRQGGGYVATDGRLFPRDSLHLRRSGPALNFEPIAQAEQWVWAQSCTPPRTPAAIAVLGKKTWGELTTSVENPDTRHESGTGWQSEAEK